jgi:hypothetical protein
LAARSWIFAAGNAGAGTAETIDIYNPTSSPTNAVVMGDGPRTVRTISRARIAPGKRVVLQITPRQQANRPLLVEASGAVVVERDLYAVKARGMSFTLGVPLG